MKPEKNDKFRYVCLGTTIFVVIAASLLFFFVLYRANSIGSIISTAVTSILPVIYGAVIAYILTPICNFLEKHFLSLFHRKKKCSKQRDRFAAAISIFLSIFLAIIIISGLVALVLPQLITSVLSIYQSLPKSEESVNKIFNSILNEHPQLAHSIQAAYATIVHYLEGWLQTELLPNLRTTFTSLTSGLLSALVFLKNLFIGFIVAVYLLGSRRLFSCQIKKILYAFFKTGRINSFLNEVSFANHAFSGFISGKLIDSIIIGLICYVGVTILGTPYGMLVSVIVGVTNIIPFFGPYIGAVPCILIILFKDPTNPFPCIYFIIFLIILQQFDGNFLGPKILGDKTGLSGFWVLFSILLFGGLFGFIGMLAGVPVFAVLYHEFRRLIHKHLQKKGMSTDSIFFQNLVAIDHQGQPVYSKQDGHEHHFGKYPGSDHSAPAEKKQPKKP